MKKFTFIAYSALCLLALFAARANSQWVQTNLQGGASVFSLTAAGTDLFAGTDAGVFLSTDHGANWSAMNSGLPSGNYYGFVMNGTNLFTGMFSFQTFTGGLFLSTDNGTNWNPITNDLPQTLPFGVFAVSGTNLFAGTGGAGSVYLSTDNGTSWTDIGTSLPRAPITALVASGTNLFAGISTNGVFLSADNGTTWTAVNTGLTDKSVSSLAIIGTNLFAGTLGGGIFLTTNNGSNWATVNNGLTNTTVRSIKVNGTNLFAATNRLIFFSTNNGTSWSDVTTGLIGFSSTCNISSLAVSGTNLFAGTTGGLGIWSRPLSEFGSLSVAEDHSVNTIELSPNPTSGLITIHNSAAEAKQITIANMLGVNVMGLNEPAAADFTLDLSKLTSGAYILKLSGGGSVTTRMIVRQ